MTGAQRRPGALPVGPVPVQLPPDRRRRGARHRAPATARTRCSCSASSRRTTTSSRGCRGRSSCARITAATGSGAGSGPGRADAVGSWREAFLRAPYLRDTFVAIGVLSETFETAITWDRFEDFHASVLSATHGGGARGLRRGLGDLPLHPRLPGRPRALLHDPRAGAPRRRARAVGARSRRAASEAVLAGGGTITHHHAVGRDHRPWYDRQRPAAVRRGAAGAPRPRSTRPARSTPAC